MTQPPYEGPPPGGPGPGSGPAFGPGPGYDAGGTPYPRQKLTPQQVTHGVNRSRIYLALAAVFALLVAGGIAFVLLQDDGEDRRAQYCAELRDLTADGDLGSALSGADPSTLDRVRLLPDTSPSSVADDWTTIVGALETAIEQQEPDLGQMLPLLGALRAVASDAKQECGLDLQLI